MWTCLKDNYWCRKQYPREYVTNLKRDKISLCNHFHVNLLGVEYNMCASKNWNKYWIYPTWILIITHKALELVVIWNLWDGLLLQVSQFMTQ